MNGQRNMSVLIDRVIDSYKEGPTKEIKGYWFVAKPLGMHTSFIDKLIDCYRILIGKSFAIHFKQDEG